MRMAGILIAGGRSSRMGVDKALLKFGGIPAIARIAAALGEVAGPVTLACGAGEREDYQFLRLRQAVDRFPGGGPLAGLHAGMCAVEAEWYLAAACDLPFASSAFMRYIVDALKRTGRPMGDGGESATGHPLAAVPVSAMGQVQPLLGLYHKDTLPSLENALAHGTFKVMRWLESLDVLYVPETGYGGVSDTEPSPLFNMNTPADYRAAADWRV